MAGFPAFVLNREDVSTGGMIAWTILLLVSAVIVIMARRIRKEIDTKGIKAKRGSFQGLLMIVIRMREQVKIIMFCIVQVRVRRLRV
mgnify:CR=1 FL=1